MGVLTLLIVDNYAALPADPAIACRLLHTTARRMAPDTLTVPRQSRCGVLAAGNVLLMSHQHRSPIS